MGIIAHNVASGILTSVEVGSKKTNGYYWAEQDNFAVPIRSSLSADPT